VFIFILLQQKI